MNENVKTNVGSIAIGSDGTRTGTTITGTTPCSHRLPCGYCPLLSRTCPMLTTAYSIPISYAHVGDTSVALSAGEGMK